MRILNVIHYPIFGGPANGIARTSKHLSNMGVELLVEKLLMRSDRRGRGASTIIISGQSDRGSLWERRFTFKAPVCDKNRIICDKNQSIMIGDSKIDAECAKKNGTKFILVKNLLKMMRIWSRGGLNLNLGKKNLKPY